METHTAFLSRYRGTFRALNLAVMIFAAAFLVAYAVEYVFSLGWLTLPSMSLTYVLLALMQLQQIYPDGVAFLDDPALAAGVDARTRRRVRVLVAMMLVGSSLCLGLVVADNALQVVGLEPWRMLNDAALGCVMVAVLAGLILFSERDVAKRRARRAAEGRA